MNGEANRMSMKSVMTEQAEDLFKKIKISDELRKSILDAIEKEYGGAEAEKVEQEISKKEDPDLNKYKERLKTI
jgi:DNA-binding cell septation regulator SpoVG